MSLTIVGAIQNGHYVAYVPGSRMRVAVPLAPIGRRIGGAEIGAICARLGTPEVSGRIWRRMKRRAKNVVKATVKIAKNKAVGRIVGQLWQSAKAATPPPYNAALVAVETGVRFGAAIAKGLPKAKKALPIVQSLAKGKISLPKAKQLAVKVGVKPNTVRNAAAMIRLKAKARSNPRLKQVFDTAAEIESVRAKPAAPKPLTKIVTARSGRRYEVQIKAA